MLARGNLQADGGKGGCWLGEESSLSAILPEWIPLRSTIPSKGGFIFFCACRANLLTLENATCHFMPAASLRALGVVNEQQVSDHLNGMSRVSNVCYQRKILHVGLCHQSAQTEKRGRAEVSCVSKLETKTSIKKTP